jgi:glucokinase
VSESLYLGLDVGGTKTAAGVVAAGGRVLSRLSCSTPELREGGDPLARLIALGRAAMESCECGEVSGVGVALPGPVDPEGARMLAAPTIPELLNLAVAPLLERAFGCPAAGENDGNACALAECRFGAGKGARDLVYVTVSTGIGGGIVLGGRVFRGAHRSSGEIGHQVVLDDPTPCDCGGRGCLETLASGRGILRRARALGLTVSSAAESADLARNGDARALALWKETGEILGLGLSNVVNLLDPEVILLGGGVGLGAADLLLDPARETLRARCMPSLSRPVRVATAGLGEDLGIVSGAALVMP